MTRTATALLALASLAAPGAAGASTDEAWEIFRQDVTAACLALLPSDAGVRLDVNPFGSENHGVALVTLPPAADGTPGDLLACVVDKATGKAELTAAFAPVE